MSETRLGRGNIFEPLPVDRESERFDTLVQLDDGLVERIVSFGQASPEGFWYDQEHSEWVLVLRGRARLEVEGEPELVELGPGDYIRLDSHTRHRVDWTTAAEPTIWLTIQY